MDNIVIAIAKGRIEKDVYRRLKILNMEDCIETDSRKLIFTDEENKITYIHVKPSDVVTYVEKGVADLGIVGKDTILENENDDDAGDQHQMQRYFVPADFSALFGTVHHCFLGHFSSSALQKSCAGCRGNRHSELGFD